MSCTCNGKGSLHNSECDVVTSRKKSSVYTIKDLAFEAPNKVFFYVALSENGSVTQHDRFKSLLKLEDWMFEVQTGAIIATTLANGSEVTFLPESEALNLLHLPNSDRVFMEASVNTKDISDLILTKTANLSFVDSETKDLL